MYYAFMEYEVLLHKACSYLLRRCIFPVQSMGRMLRLITPIIDRPTSLTFPSQILTLTKLHSGSRWRLGARRVGIAMTQYCCLKSISFKQPK
jgi:hypothetical protein